jgi:hypothetical protein
MIRRLPAASLAALMLGSPALALAQTTSGTTSTYSDTTPKAKSTHKSAAHKPTHKAAAHKSAKSKKAKTKTASAK